MNKKLRQLIYNRALEQDSWISLIPYPRLLFSWQNAAIKREDMKTVKLIAAVSGHMNPNHTRCKKKCDVIDEFIK